MVINSLYLLSTDIVHEEVIEDSKTSEETRISLQVEDGNTKESNQPISPDDSDDVKMKSDVNNEDIEEVTHTCTCTCTCTYTLPDCIKFTYYDGSYTLIRW